MGAAKIAEAPLKPSQVDSVERASRGDDAARTGIGPFKSDIADGESNGMTLILVEESIFPEGAHAIDFQRSAKTPARLLQIKFIKPAGGGSQRLGGHDQRPVTNRVVWKAFRSVAHDDRLVEEGAEPSGRRRGLGGKPTLLRRDTPAARSFIIGSRSR